MAALTKLGGLSSTLFSLRQPMLPLFRCVTTTLKETNNYDHWLPRPYPKTEEERRISADIYHMHPAEYKLYPENHIATRGDWPMPPTTSYQSRDPFYPWDMPTLKRSFHETYHAELIGIDRTPLSFPRDYSIEGGGLFCVAFVFILGVITIMHNGYSYVPALDEQIQKRGGAHYTFEPAK